MKINLRKFCITVHYRNSHSWRTISGIRFSNYSKTFMNTDNVFVVKVLVILFFLTDLFCLSLQMGFSRNWICRKQFDSIWRYFEIGIVMNGNRIPPEYYFNKYIRNFCNFRSSGEVFFNCSKCLRRLVRFSVFFETKPF